MWHARRMMAKEIHRPGEIMLTVGKEGRYYKPGSLIKVQHERFKIGIGSGEITELIRDGNQIVGLKLMERFDIASDRDYWIEYYVVDVDRNHVVNKQIISVGKYTDVLMFTIPIPIDSDDVPVFGNILSAMHGEPGVSRVWEAKKYLVSDLSENEQGYDLTLVPYSDVVYDTTSIDQIPEYQSCILSAAPKVYDATGRMPLDGDSGQGLIDPLSIPMFVNPLIEEMINNEASNIAQSAPRYRGFTSVADTGNTGVISGNTMNHGDWIAYMGNPVGIWRATYCYRWNNGQWAEIPLTETAPYMAALADLTAGAVNGAFNAVFVRQLFAQTLNADEINVALRLLIGAVAGQPNSGIEISGANGTIRRRGFTDRDGVVPGFVLQGSDGLIETNNMRTRNIDAVNMTATNSTIEGGITAGGVWDINGNQLPSGGITGGIWFPRFNDYGKIRGVYFEGTTQFGTDDRTSLVLHQNGSTIYKLRNVKNEVSPSRQITGVSQTLNQLQNQLNNVFFGTEVKSSIMMPITGALSYSGTGEGDPGFNMNLVGLACSNDNIFRLFGSNRMLDTVGTVAGYTYDFLLI
jgi:hypothetical protein